MARPSNDNPFSAKRYDPSLETFKMVCPAALAMMNDFAVHRKINPIKLGFTILKSSGFSEVKNHVFDRSPIAFLDVGDEPVELPPVNPKLTVQPAVGQSNCPPGRRVEFFAVAGE